MTPPADHPRSANNALPRPPRARRRAACAFALLLFLLAVCEWLAAAAAYRTTLTADDWSSAREQLAALSPDDPVFLADPWLSPRARLELPRLRAWDSLAPPDLYGLPRFHVLSRRGDDPWTPELRREWGPAPLPPVTDRRALSPGLTLTTLTPTNPPRLLEDWLHADRRLQVHDRHGPCRRRGDAWRCKSGELLLTTVEIDYRPRRALCLDLDDDAHLRISLKNAQLGDHLRGHLGFSDFNARIRSDSPIRLTLRIDGADHPSLLFTDAQGWTASLFTARTKPGRHDVELELEPATTGTHGPTGYRQTPRHRACLELRAFAS